MSQRLHQLLAVKKDAAQRAHEVEVETKKTLGAKHFFQGSTKTYRPYDEEDTTRIPEETESMSYTVGEKLAWFAKNFGNIIDIEFQIERTNGDATADVEVGDFYLVGAPATFLLDLQGFLERIRAVYANIPVLDPKYRWAPDVTNSPGVFKTVEPEVTFRSKKLLRHKVLYEATPEHPAQVEKWGEDIQVGQYTKDQWSGALTAAQKATVLGRIDELITATRKALSAANDTEHDNSTVAAKLFNYINKGIPTEGLYREEDL